MKTRTRLSIFSLLLLLIPLIGCSSSSETTDVSSSNAEQSDTAVEDTAVDTADAGSDAGDAGSEDAGEGEGEGEGEAGAEE